MQHKLEQAIQLTDDKNVQDPSKEIVGNESFPKELLYSQRMTRHFLQFVPHKAALQLELPPRTYSLVKRAL